MKVKITGPTTSEEVTIKDTGITLIEAIMLDLTFIPQSELDEEILKKAENLVNPVKTERLTLGIDGSGKRKLAVTIIIGKDE